MANATILLVDDDPDLLDLTHACALRAGASPEALRRSILLGVGAAMPSYADSLPDERSRRSLIAHIKSLSTGPRSQE